MKRSKKAKRLLAGLLALLLAITCTPLYSLEVRAEEEEEERLTEGNFTYKVNEDGTSVTITRYQMDVNCLDVTIPSEIAGKSVASIGEYAFDDCSGLKSVSIPGSVISIGNGAFYGCSNLKSVSIPGSVTSIGNEAFSSCSGLKSVSILDGVASIGDEAFSRCSNL